LEAVCKLELTMSIKVIIRNRTVIIIYKSTKF